MANEPVTRLFGWCSPTDQFHAGCKVGYINPRTGVVVRCSCPNHRVPRRAIPPRKKVKQ